jgi:predicted adenylyl cyclase CyaB
MHIKNVEFKAKVETLDFYENLLLQLHPTFIGTDHQIDTYFNVPNGRLKLREGNIENALIQYDRANVADIKQSDIMLYKHAPNSILKEILVKQMGVKAIVDKIRRIYFIENVKFHFDEVKNLGFFLEVEAIDDKGIFTSEQLKQQCDEYFALFQLTQSQLMEQSYSDLIMAKHP